MDQRTSYVWRFLIAIWSDWVALVSGVISFILLMIGAGLDVTIPSRVALVGCALGLLLASYRVWKKECQEREQDTVRHSENVAQLQAQLDEKARRRELHDRLGALLARGQKLLGDCSRESEPPPQEEAQAWAKETETLILGSLGQGSVELFRTDAGLPRWGSPVMGAPHRQLLEWVHTRVARLAQFLGDSWPQ